MNRPTAPSPAIVIGAGFGGLAAAVRLRAQGHRVIVLEARDQPGGRAGVFHRDGYTFDAGPTVITAPHLFDELFELVDRDPRDYYTLQPVDPFYRISFPDGTEFDYVGDDERLFDQIRKFNPEDVDNYKRLAEHARDIFEIGYEELVDQPFDRFSTMLRIIPDMIRLRNYRSVYSLVASYIDNDKLRQVFTFQPLLVGGNPFNVTSIYLLIHHLERKWGVHFPEGGTTALVESLAQLLEDIGVERRLNTPVERILVERDSAVGVRTAGGDEIRSNVVVSNADPGHTYGELIDERHRSTNDDDRLESIQQSMGLFVGYFGADRLYPDIEHHTIVLGDRYEELLEDIFERKELADDFSLYLHRSTATDPSLAPEGHDAFYVLSPVPNNKSGLDWEAIGESYFDRILEHLEDRHLPGLRDHLTTRFHVTPNYFEDELRSVAGAGFGPEPRLTQSAWFRFHNRSEDIDDLYFVGAGTHPGAGLPGVLNSAKIAEKLVPAADVGVGNQAAQGRR
ncbi:MAG: phytoene desaturase family protein [Bradymonadaceae bacterium]